MRGRITNETELIDTYLVPLAAGYPGAFGLKDDAALIESEPGFDLVVSTDPIIAGVHFFGDDDARDIAWKALAVNCSDLAAKGAEPIAYAMALAFPEAPKHAWMADFSAGLAAAQAAFGCHLIGGDTDHTPGPLSISITAFGRVPRGQMVRRGLASAGDHVFVSGTLGDAALGLKLRRSPDVFADSLPALHRQHLLDRYLRPQPRLALASTLRTYASAALDVSDGLIKDAGRLAASAGARLTIQSADVPLSQAARAALAGDDCLWQSIVAGGDDYEILCAVPAAHVSAFVEAARAAPSIVTRLGVLEVGSGVSLNGPAGTPLQFSQLGYDHFGSS